MIPSEHDEQRYFVQWFRRRFPSVRIFAVPNGGARGKATAGRLKAEGVSKGVPDLCIPEWAFWIEMKRRKGGVLSPEQKDWLEYLNESGHKAVVCRGMDEAIQEAEIRAKEVRAWPLSHSSSR
ncbi:VRR-NUC domain-containing protein [Dethiosulfovibrio sp. F2B]|uniref:VRR-NUC domain-containing protein n=1 Tax=Dethiosulfovibrio faecalis TaxID=2720018 RepID=UPI001F1B7982|nr:VRR-NUC domain-containing protein [Dethiosulfovibrio faecalis]